MYKVKWSNEANLDFKTIRKVYSMFKVKQNQEDF